MRFILATEGSGIPLVLTGPERTEGGTETVLLVEDEERVRLIATEVLERVGYRVLPEASAEAALSRARQHSGRIELLLTDDADRANEIARELEAVNAERRAVEQRIVWEAEAQVAELGQRSAYVLASEDWHPGVIGIVGIPPGGARVATELGRKAGRVEHARAALHELAHHRAAVDCVKDRLPHLWIG